MNKQKYVNLVWYTAIATWNVATIGVTATGFVLAGVVGGVIGFFAGAMAGGIAALIITPIVVTGKIAFDWMTNNLDKDEVEEAKNQNVQGSTKGIISNIQQSNSNNVGNKSTPSKDSHESSHFVQKFVNGVLNFFESRQLHNDTADARKETNSRFNQL